MSGYRKVEQVEYEHDECPTVSRSRSYHSGRYSLLVGLILLVLTTLNIALFASTSNSHGLQPPEARFSRTPSLDAHWRRFFWHTKYSPSNHTDSDYLWDRILPSHGFVAMDRQQAARDGWPESMYLPSDESKGVYLLEAYHQLHCLKIIRKTFWEAVEQRPYTYSPSSHLEHCFDALRQSTICNADNLPLYTFGDRTAGDGQMHKCRSWGQLRDYATQNSACYRDSVVDVPLGDHFGHCDDGNDGVLDI